MNPGEAGKLESPTDPVSVISKLEKYVASIFLLRGKMETKTSQKAMSDNQTELFASVKVQPVS